MPHHLLAPAGGHVFEALDIAATLFVPGRWRRHRGWLEIHKRPAERDIMTFEVEHGVEIERVGYNDRCLAEVRRTRVTLTARYAGLTDLFVPVVVGTQVPAVLVTGPFATSWPSGPEILERWRALTGRQGHPTDPEFWQYLASTLTTLVLEGKQPAMFQRLVTCLAKTMATSGSSDALLDEIEALTVKLAEARAVDRMWEVARTMVDPTTTHVWASPHHHRRLGTFGFERFPDRVIVGLMVSRTPADPVDEIVRRDAFQRACAKAARAAGNTASGRVGHSGVTFIGAGRRLVDWADKLRALARREFGLALHIGVGPGAGPLSTQYQGALAAAESALSSGAALAEAKGPPAPNPLGTLRRELARLAVEKPAALGALFERYGEAVAVRFGHSLDAARAHLEAGFERAAEPLAAGRAMDVKSFETLRAALDRDAGESGSMPQLASVYRRALLDITEAAQGSSEGRRVRSLARAEQYMREHYAEPLSLKRVAGVAGFAPGYFSTLFHKKERVTFEQYLTKIRVERARQLLSGTVLELERVAQLTGLGNRHYFGHVFKRSTGETPMAYRRRVAKQVTQ